MLYKLGALLFLVCLSYGRNDFNHFSKNCVYDEDAVPLANEGVNNYVVDWLEGFPDGFVPFPYAINKCTLHSLLDHAEPTYYLHTCGSDGHAYTQAYSDSSCNDTSKIGKLVRLSGHHGVKVAHVKHFECSGENTYAELHLGIGENNDTCNHLQTIYAGLGACVGTKGTGGGDIMFSLYCDSTATTIEWFVHPRGYDKNPDTTQVRRRNVLQETTPVQAEATTSTDGSDFIGDISTTPFSEDNDYPCSEQRYCFDLTIPVTNNSCQTLYTWQEKDLTFSLYGYSGECTGTPDSSPAARLSASLLLIVFTFIGVLIL